MSRSVSKEKAEAHARAEQLRDGVVVIPDSELNELDKPEVQEAILHPQPIEVELEDGTILKCKSAYGPKDERDRKIGTKLTQLINLLIIESAKLGGNLDANGQPKGDSRTYFLPASMQENVQAKTLELIAATSGHDVKLTDISDNNLSLATTAFLNLMLERSAKANEVKKQSPNVKVPA